MLGAQLPKVAARVCLATVRVGYAASDEGATACRTARLSLPHRREEVGDMADHPTACLLMKSRLNDRVAGEAK
ncbi:hypothetical protein MesoLj131b_70260 (plasmid) [Mesorhizobium sp. 131-2-5]|nr:hypothetical protein MesoLj131b_70260 [Mesorhizobium sp. 131-2-5]